MEAKILIIDDDDTLLTVTNKIFLHEGYEVVTATDYNKALALLDKTKVDLIFTDIILGARTGIDILNEVKNRKLACPVVLITGFPTVKTAAEAVRLGAYDYIPKPIKSQTLIRVAAAALKHKLIIDENLKYRLNLEAIFKSVKDAIITVDKEMNIIEINKGAERLFNVIAANVKGKAFKYMCNDTGIENAIIGTNKIKQPIEIRRLECKLNNHLPKRVVSITTYPFFDVYEEFNGCVLVLKDETRLTRLERDLNERRRFHNIIGESDVMKKIYSLIDILSNVPTTVLITGESGTGKELVADALHYNGERKDKPFVKVNCSALSESILESELFGHVKGAFTGAINDRKGRFETANGGTIFLDEIGDISSRMQTRLLRVVQEMEFERVGESSPTKVEVRIVTATNQDLRKKVQEGSFRKDLYHRLKVMQLNMPPLRERREDIPLLLNYFKKKLNDKFNKQIEGFSIDVQKIFMDYEWPGNVRELKNILEHSFVICCYPVISRDDLPFEFANIYEPQLDSPKEKSVFNRQAIVQALKKSGGNKAKASRLLGLSRWTLYEKIRKHKISDADWLQ